MISAADSLTQAKAFYLRMDSRRSVRHFSGKPVHRETIAHLIRTASTAPSGAHKQPWTFVAVSDPATKRKIRQAAEAEEKQSYETRMPDEWLEALEPLATGWRKPYLEIAPWLVVLFQQTVEQLPEGETRKNYYVVESVGIAAGMFLTAVHQAGLVSLTHTPSPMKFLADILKRPSNEKPFLLMPVGYPEEGCQVPDLQRKGLDQVALFIEGPTPPR
ncbi:MAG: nitroreductase family protein [Candidatus Marinimicrobia bacterium]|nr:nitroreductase family protein [Candidatus Neomarinimicrobiota bacterium]